ncbi:uncharacterized protein LOC119734552 [Patiria miniata]|uniref:Transposase n=1 Tax=Patiria miniata TaxID=46514 RepID=A0A914AKB9_PATMI|nr:uncharacterized protein LOC119734552 [Patiria miniata]
MPGYLLFTQAIICSIHFQDEKPSKNNPYPSLHMGYKPHKQLSSGRHAPRLRRDLKLQEQESVSVSEHAVHEMPHASPVCGETILPASLATTCKDASVQWYDFSTADHTYATNPSCPMKSQVKATQTRQTDTSPELSASDMGDDTSKFYTGLSVHVFWALVKCLSILPNLPTFKMKLCNQLLLVLMRLRLGLFFFDLGTRFKVSQSTACQIFREWIPILARFMREHLIFWPSRDTLQRIRPRCFLEHYPRATCIIDCTEMFVQRPRNLKQRAQTYSNYKHHNTFKLLYCIAPNGFVMYLSKLFGGRASDKFITQSSGILQHLQPGDEVLADKGFTIDDILPPGVKLSIPAFTTGNKDHILPEEEVTRTRRLANVRIHVERAIRRLKCYKILSTVIPGRVMNVDNIVTVCAGLCNLQPLLIQGEPETEEMITESDDDFEDEWLFEDED